MNHPPAITPVDSVALRHAGQCLMWGWLVIGGACVLALVPLLGFLIWFIGPPFILAALILAIIAMTKGRTGGGIALLLFSLVIAPGTFMLGPIIATALGAAAADSVRPSPNPAPLENFGSGPATDPAPLPAD